MDILDQNDPWIKKAFHSINTITCKLEELFAGYIPILNGERYITEKRLEEPLHISDRTLQDYRSQDLIGYLKLTKKIMYRESDIEKTLQKAYVEAWK